jgi:tRNA splicing endonuclease
MIICTLLLEECMTARTITVTIPELLYVQLQAAARSSAQTLDVVIAQSLERTIPAQLLTLLPTDLQAELHAMEQLSDAALQAIALSTAPSARAGQLEVLSDLKRDGTILPEQLKLFQSLRDETEALMVRKAHAFVLLKSRGHILPLPDQLPVPRA